MGKTITEKIFAAHLRDKPAPGNMVLDIDVIMCHEITTPIAIMDLVARGKDRVCEWPATLCSGRPSSIRARSTTCGIRLRSIPRASPIRRTSPTCSAL